MALTNFERMVQLADDVFAVRTDPDQLQVDQDVLANLRKIHLATVSEYDDGNGPVAWVLIIPTTAALMQAFLSGQITEMQLYERTPVGAVYEAVYLCSGMVLEEYRRQGIAGQLALAALARIRADHPIAALFTWAFTEEGRIASIALARATGLPLLERSFAELDLEGRKG